MRHDLPLGLGWVARTEANETQEVAYDGRLDLASRAAREEDHVSDSLARMTADLIWDGRAA